MELKYIIEVPDKYINIYNYIIQNIITIFQLKPFLAMLLTGPYLGFLITNNIHEQPAIWCYTEIGQMLLTYYLLK